MRTLLAATLALVAAGCGSAPPDYFAEAATPETVVDGEAAEWPAALRPVPQEAGLSLGLRRDGDDLIVVVIASDDRQARRIAVGGLRLWVDPTGGTDRVLGVRYPAPPAPDARSVARSGPLRGGAIDDADPTRLRRRFESGLDQVEVTRGVLTQRASADGGFGGLEAESTWGSRGLVVEMRIPLVAAPGLLETAAGDAIGLGIELLDAQSTRREAMMRSRQPRPTTVGDDDRPMPPPEGPALEPDGLDIATITRWLRAEVG
ncbi:hypothetical protein [Rubrivirga marina]|uniref:Uncharacterized protein n=1 Tax=Rubrivirga marina TaxID=1196024 RepID=A0A271IYE0_9BACT|nr:hypothetical protein [Rubrivirga marina]PAP75539.1 hypothetical protein BSZ37_03330 [Rubrivirga marina]